MNMLWAKGPKADFEILVCLYKIDVICKRSPHTIGLFNRTGRNPCTCSLQRCLIFILNLLDFCFDRLK